MIKDLFYFSIKLTKTIILLPIIIASFVYSHFNPPKVTKFRERLNRLTNNSDTQSIEENDDETLSEYTQDDQNSYFSIGYWLSYFKFLSPKFYINMIGKMMLNIISKIISFVVILGAFSITAIIALGQMVLMPVA